MDLEERAFLQQVAAREVLLRAVSALAAADVRAMVLKGIWLQLAVLPAERLRPVGDVDLLVQEHAFERAASALRQAGFVGDAPDARQVTLRFPGDPLAIDLHRRLFDTTSFRMPTGELFARAQGPHELARGLAVWLPDPLDGFAHLVGHATHCRVRPRDRERMRDFADLSLYAHLDPLPVARHLERCGMRRAARYVLAPELVGDSAFFRGVRAALAPDPLGEVLAHVCAWAIPRTRVTQPAGGAWSYLLEDNLRHAARAIAYRSGLALRRRLLAK